MATTPPDPGSWSPQSSFELSDRQQRRRSLSHCFSEQSPNLPSGNSRSTPYSIDAPHPSSRGLLLKAPQFLLLATNFAIYFLWHSSVLSGSNVCPNLPNSLLPRSFTPVPSWGGKGANNPPHLLPLYPHPRTSPACVYVVAMCAGHFRLASITRCISSQ